MSNLPSPIGLTKEEFVNLVKKINEQELSISNLEDQYNGKFWHYPSYYQDNSDIEMVFEANTSDGLVQFAIDYGDCLADSGMIAFLAANGSPPKS